MRHCHRVDCGQGSFWLSATALVFGATLAAADEPLFPAKAPAPPEVSAAEPLAGVFSINKAADYVENAAVHWTQSRKCGTCHTNYPYLLSGPALAPVRKPNPMVRAFFEDMVTRQWEKSGPRWEAEVICAAVTLALNDRATTNKLHPVTRRALDRMWKVQRADGGFHWLKCGWPPMESDDHFGATWAAIGVGAAPGDYARTPQAAKGIDGIRRWLKNNPPPSLHHEVMVLWASLSTDGLMTREQRTATLSRLLALQLPDGGWATATFFQGWKNHKRKDDKKPVVEAGDGYGTGLVVYLARRCGTPANDPRLVKAIGWLNSNQRTSGRWFTPSPTKDSKHYLTNYGTTFAILALESCGEIKPSGQSAAINRR